MKLLSILLLAASCVSAGNVIDSEHPRTPKRVWIRRITLAAGCAASLALDTWSTQQAVNAGALEGNRLFANAQGQLGIARGRLDLDRHQRRRCGALFLGKLA